MKSQKGPLSAGRDFCFSSNLSSCLAESKAQGFDFVVTPLFHPRRRRHFDELSDEVQLGGNQSKKLDLNLKSEIDMSPSTRSDTVVTSDDWQHLVVPRLSSWINVDDTNELERKMSEKAFVEEMSLASHLSVSAVVYNLQGPKCSNLARMLYTHFSRLHGFVSQVWVEVPACSSREDASEENDNKEDDPWLWWDRLRLIAHSHIRIGVALVIGSNAPEEEAFQRWLGEPVRAVFVDTSAFLTNRSGFPVLPKVHQFMIQRLFKLGTQPIITGHCRSGKGYQVYSQYLNHLFKTMPAKTIIESFATGYEDCLQCPLQPLMDNLESQTYETFERDSTKYELYHQAVVAAMVDLVPVEERKERAIIVMVVGAGRGPLVAATLKAARKTNCRVKIYAVEKNPNAIVTLRNRRVNDWANDDVTIVASDMRSWQPPELADILVSELLGSFGDNELSPECLDSAQHFLKKDTGISIPSSYTSYIAPIQTPRLYAELTQTREHHGYHHPEYVFELPYVVRFHNANIFAEPQPMFTFSHPNFDLLNLSTNCTSAFLSSFFMYQSGKKLTMRSLLVNSYIQRAEFDKTHSKILCKGFYSVDLTALPVELSEKFVQCNQDDETDAFLEQSYQKSDWFMTQVFHLVAARMLGFIISKTSINGLLGRGSMFVFSTAQFRKLLRVDDSWKGHSFLDIGAGDGNVTDKMAPLFEYVYVTEKSAPMCWRLGRKEAFHLLTAESWTDHDISYNVISCLNVLDRCSHPITLLSHMRRKLAKDGILVVAFAFPFSPYVEQGDSTKPIEQLDITGSTYEEQVISFTEIMQRIGLELVSFTKVPYLCDGDLSSAYYTLTDAVFVFKIVP